VHPDLVNEFKEIYRRRFGEELNEREALRKAIALAGLFRAIYRPIPKEKESVYREIRICYNDDITDQS
jgi:hypothetical protein